MKIEIIIFHLIFEAASTCVSLLSNKDVSSLYFNGSSGNKMCILYELLKNPSILLTIDKETEI